MNIPAWTTGNILSDTTKWTVLGWNHIWIRDSKFEKMSREIRSIAQQLGIEITRETYFISLSSRDARAQDILELWQSSSIRANYQTVFVRIWRRDDGSYLDDAYRHFESGGV